MLRRLWQELRWKWQVHQLAQLRRRAEALQESISLDTAEKARVEEAWYFIRDQVSKHGR